MVYEESGDDYIETLYAVFFHNSLHLVLERRVLYGNDRVIKVIGFIVLLRVLYARLLSVYTEYGNVVELSEPIFGNVPVRAT